MRRIALAAVLGCVAVGFASASGCGSDRKRGGGDSDAVTVSVVDEVTRAPVIGASVVLHGSNGEAVESLVTGSDGLAVFTPDTDGGWITVVNTSAASTWLRSVAAVERGDDLVIPIPDGGGAAAPAATPSFALDSDYPGAAGYALEPGCAIEVVFSTAGTISIPTACVDENGTYSIAAIAGDIGATALAFAFLEDVPVAQSALGFGAWRTDFVDHVLTWENGPAGPASLYGSVVTRRAGSGYGTGDVVSTTTSAGTFTVRLLPEIGSSTVTALQLTYGGTPVARAFHISGVEGITTAQTLDGSAELLPRVQATAFAAGPPRSVSWTTPVPVEGDAVQVQLYWAAGAVEWIAYAPAGSLAPLVLPSLPPGLEAMVPAGATTSGRLRFVEADFIGSYLAFKTEFLPWVPTGAISFTSTDALESIPLAEVPTAFQLEISESSLP